MADLLEFLLHIINSSTKGQSSNSLAKSQLCSSYDLLSFASHKVLIKNIFPQTILLNTKPSQPRAASKNKNYSSSLFTFIQHNLTNGVASLSQAAELVNDVSSSQSSSQSRTRKRIQSSSKWILLLKLVSGLLVAGLSTTVIYKIYQQVKLTREFIESSAEDHEISKNSKSEISLMKPKIVWTPKTVNIESLSMMKQQNQLHDRKVVNILVLFGTEFGFSKQVATKVCEMIVDKLNRLQTSSFLYVPRLLDVKYFKIIDWSKETCVITVCSTYGEGVPPNSALSFFEHLQAMKQHEIVTSNKLFYSVLALGDKSYSHFCRAGKTLDSLFESKFLNGIRLLERVDVDRDDWRVINKWISNLLTRLQEENLMFNADEFIDYLQQDSVKLPEATESNFDRTNPFYATIIEKRQLCNDTSDQNDIRECIHFCLDLSSSIIPAPTTSEKSQSAQQLLKYLPGDALGVLPENDPHLVDILVKYLGLYFTSEHSVSNVPLVKTPSNYYSPNDKSKIDIAEEHILSAMPEYITLKDALTRFYDLKNVNIALIRLLWEKQNFTGLECVKSKLECILQDESVCAHYLQERWLQDVLEDYLVPLIFDRENKQWSKLNTVSIQDVLEHLKLLLPRYYSISSSSSLTSNETASVTVSIVSYKSANNKTRHGVATHFLKRANQIPVFISPNTTFKLPQDTRVPIIMVGPGTGIAPFKGFIEERLFTKSTGRNLLFYGCRDRNKDFLYRKELEKWSEQGDIELYVAFSRENPSKKVYVQDLLLEHSLSIYELLTRDNAYFYICGDGSSMCPSVLTTLRSIFLNYHPQCKSIEDASHQVELLESERRLCKDVW
ncbi:hypothetical protein C9374_012777 [Naegleria lovaniensis]|uniref:Uncharacterized protein n=1 Tax=Naegleria lovaniensis TaxID=51637 RepID=A0AA88KBM3_NAELO|nr:uncharacterized protein C9374_012777 [Naegleria lovaniensis]KAG2373175.1 hypothetical protein C9374_012777 [Naegleria lovaniensis]